MFLLHSQQLIMRIAGTIMEFAFGKAADLKIRIDRLSRQFTPRDRVVHV